MSFDDVILAFKQENLKAGEKYVLIALAECRNSGTKLCFPSYQFLADKTGYSPKQIGRNVKTLAEKGLIKISKKETPSGYLGNHYSFSWDKNKKRIRD